MWSESSEPRLGPSSPPTSYPTYLCGLIVFCWFVCIVLICLSILCWFACLY
jgi:hypothetical protein